MKEFMIQHRKACIAFGSFILAVLVISLGLYIVFLPSSEIEKGEMLEVTFHDTNLSYTITDPEVIQTVLDTLNQEEVKGFQWDEEYDYDYVIEVFTPTTSYGPIMCFENLNILQYADEVSSMYIPAHYEFFSAIRNALRGLEPNQTR